MMTNIFVKPATVKTEAGETIVLVRDPETGIPLDANGEWKAKSPFWTRRLRDKDVVEAGVEPAIEPSEAAPRKRNAK
jgi:hypothetical protein